METIKQTKKKSQLNKIQHNQAKPTNHPNHPNKTIQLNQTNRKENQRHPLPAEVVCVNLVV
jgi:hypothetical protein